MVRVAPGPADPAELARRILEPGTTPSGARGSARPRAPTWQRSATRTRPHGATRRRSSRRAIVADPTRPLRARWAASLAAVGVDDTLVEEGYGVSYVRALESFERTP